MPSIAHLSWECRWYTVRCEIFAEEPGAMTDFMMRDSASQQRRSQCAVTAESIPEFLYPHAHIHISTRSYPFGKLELQAGRETTIGECATTAAMAAREKRLRWLGQSAPYIE